MGHPDIPGYQILGEIGTGGMGVVYRATHVALDRIVALKVIHPKFVSDQEFVKSFAQEAKIIARLSHPNLVSVYDFGCHEGMYYLSMQYVQGSMLRDLLFIRRPTLGECASIVTQVADALDYAHREEVIHRDIKPGNIVLCPGGKAVLIDFGVAHGFYSGAENSVWLAAGSRSYMSPEQCKGHKATPRSDQYSLGVVVYEMLTERLPFQATEPLAVMQQHISDTPPPLCRGRTDLTPRIEATVLRALSKIPEMRFPSVSAFALELEAAFRQAESLDRPLVTAVSAGPVIGTPVVSLGAPGVLAGPVSLVDGAPIASLPQTVHRNGYLHATRGAHTGIGRRSLLVRLLILLFVGGLGAAGYTAYMHVTGLAAAEKAKTAADKAAISAAARSSQRRSGRARRRARGSSRPATPSEQPASAAPKGATSGPTAGPAQTSSTDEPASTSPPSTTEEENDKPPPSDEKPTDSNGPGE